ncbi:probable steroid 5 alpha-reductase [Phialocephala subalpina]|uniref:Probable steroid 5 alpha-reductase n=1 Tax=Phialocephala subalpina TaxID=576137 RepID=A0A1L7X3H9_9HELO|nr:probable steroid 5 alpha-reductase [Phialocephala subalpina]
MALVENWLPPSRENWELVVWLFQFFPLITIAQWGLDWYGAGKTSGKSVLNIPGKIAWITMEVPGFITLLYVMNTLPAGGFWSLPWESKAMGGLFVLHYLYRAILCPLLNPSMAPIHLLVWLFAIAFQVTNGLSIGGWLGAYGPTTRAEWQREGNYKAGGRMELGLMIWALGFFGNIFHDDELREIRRASARNQKKRAQEAEQSTGKGKGEKTGVDKVYLIPQNGLFWWIFYPHYLCEWIEWGGFYIMAGSGCVPARNFLLNEIATMLPRAVQGKRWYIERFGKEKVAGRKAVIPGII